MHRKSLELGRPCLCFYTYQRKSFSIVMIIVHGKCLLVETKRYLLAQGIGSIVLPPYSECYGRKKLYVGSTAVYSIFCVLISAAELPGLGAFGRLITGFLSAVPSAVINGSMQDMFDTRELIWLTLPYMGMANLGIAMGPVMSAYITDAWGW